MPTPPNASPTPPNASPTPPNASPPFTSASSPRGTQFRQWATACLSEYLVKGFAMHDERLKNPPRPVDADFEQAAKRLQKMPKSKKLKPPKL